MYCITTCHLSILSYTLSTCSEFDCDSDGPSNMNLEVIYYVGVRDVKPGDQLTWQLPMPADPRELLQLMGQTEGGTLGSRQAVTSSPVLSTLR